MKLTSLRFILIISSIFIFNVNGFAESGFQSNNENNLNMYLPLVLTSILNER